MNGTATGAPLLERLREALATAHVAWRPGDNGGPSPSGARSSEHLEILVDGADAGRCREILARLGFKEARPLGARRASGVGWHLGHDGSTGRIVRVAARPRPDTGAGAVTAVEPGAAAPPDRLALASGGALIAVVGADGSGKSTALEALRGWLAPHFRVETVHLGKPRWSWITLPIKGGLKVAAILAALGPTRTAAAPDRAEGPASLRILAWRAATARDRWRAVRWARRLAARGALVLCDRFPLAEIGTMDGVRGGPPGGTARGRTARWLAAVEARAYAAIGRPDLLLVLRVDPEVALRRRPEDPEDRVRRRAEEVLRVDWASTGARVVETDRPLPEVHREMKEWIWARL